ncbi:50S ribosomal protein L30 [Bifidobacterium aquikefiri]|uniref:Large ribosomal subunit protein uL30 n=1 Tax=Bifidobacterium aquikefiri TaxID=1653207 RepID=A0A261G3L9_9BIFI|nr:50S ribosomal protein L30 [Bifidobacterium aquikefiri]OZG65783.1 50S ribosomal protein L30 [Bifidobacterium aquikefiri]
MTKQIKITLVKGFVNQTARQKNNVLSLGLHKIGQSVVREDTPVYRGMAHAVRHLVTVEEVD